MNHMRNLFVLTQTTLFVPVLHVNHESHELMIKNYRTVTKT